MSRDELLIGDPAPELRISEFLKGSPFARFEPGAVYVVEFWATWCGPCRRSIPHLSALQAAYPEITVLGVAAMEPELEPVKAFLEEKGDEIGYSIARDVHPENGGRRGWSYLAWCQAAYQFGVPSAFVVDRSGRIAWIGNPLEIDRPLAAVAAGTWDIEAEAKAHRDRLAEEKVRESTEMRRVVGRRREAGDIPGAVRAFDEAFALHPIIERQFWMHKVEFLLQNDPSALTTYVRHLLRTLGPAQPDLYLSVGIVLMKAHARTSGGPGAAHPDGAFAALARTALLEAEAAGTAEMSAFARMALNETLAEAMLALGEKGEALARARAARDWAGAVEGMDVSTQPLDELVARCETGAETAAAVVCDGDACRIAVA